jgi:sugar phosphate permease
VCESATYEGKEAVLPPPQIPSSTDRSMDGKAIVRREATQLWGGGSGKALVAIAMGWGLMIGTRMIYPVILPQLSAEFDLTLTTAGFLVTIIWLAYALGQVPGGILADESVPTSPDLCGSASIEAVVSALGDRV